MNSHSYLKSCVVVLAASMLLLMVAAESKSNVLFSKAFAGNTCVNTPGGCFNTGSGNQNNKCYNIQTQFDGCTNSGVGSGQNNKCYNIRGGLDGCDNFGIGSHQNNNCYNIQSAPGETGCLNSGDGSTQSNLCQRSPCQNTGNTPSNIQSTKCFNAGTCSNTGDHTTVIAANSPCSSSGDHSTTICTSGRIVVAKQH
jgi:hypothetical protein